MANAFLALGSNLDRPLLQMQTAIAALTQDPNINISAVSSLYQTPAMGPPQDDYLNAVVQIETSYSPQELLCACLTIEKQQGRVRRECWGPRLIDIDVLLYDNLIYQDKTYQVPHPGLKERLFVLIPLYEIAPKLTLPDGETIAALLQQFNQAEKELILKINDSILIPGR